MSYALARNYQTQALMTASPAELVAMLYERAIQLLRETERAIQDGRIEARHNANAKAMDVIHHLDMTLDREQGGEIAERLGSLYAFILRKLAEVDRLNDADIPREMIALLEPIRDSWRALARDGTPMPKAQDTSHRAVGEAPRPLQPAAPAPAAAGGFNFSA